MHNILHDTVSVQCNPSDMLTCGHTDCYSSLSTNWDILEDRETQGTKAAVTAAVDVAPNCEPERAGNAVCTSRERHR